MAAITVTPTSPFAAKDACLVSVTGADENDASKYDATKYPTEPEIKAYLKFVKGGVEYGRSYIFAVSSAGKHDFSNYVFPTSGSWTVTLHDASDDSQLATQSVTVQA
jgi:hypothetical protein